MANPNPACTVDGFTTPVDVTTPGTSTIALANTASAQFWSITCTSTDETNTAASVNSSLVVNQGTKTATFTRPAAGSTLIFQSVVGIANLGTDANNVTQASFTTTFAVHVKTAGGFRVIATNEGVEGNATYGWITKVNNMIRNGSPPGGAAGGDLGGTYPNPQVFQLTGNAGSVIVASGTALAGPASIAGAGANIEVQPQKSTGAASGSFGVNVQAPGGGTTEAYFYLKRAGTTLVQIGPHPAAPATLGGVFLGNVIPSGTNGVIMSTGVNSLFNCDTGGTGSLTVATVAIAQYNVSGFQLGATAAFGGGTGVMGIANAGAAPTSNPTGGGVLFASGGALKWRGSSGTVTTIAVA